MLGIMPRYSFAIALIHRDLFGTFRGLTYDDAFVSKWGAFVQVWVHD